MAENPKELAEYQSDHDLLVVLNERVLILTKAVEKKSDDHEIRIRTLESISEDFASSSRTWRYIVGITLPVLFVALGYIFAQFYTLASTLDKRINTAITTQLIDYSLIKTDH